MKKTLIIMLCMLMVTACASHNNVTQPKAEPFAKIKYDKEAPTHIKVPRLLEIPGEYDPSDKNTFPIYTDAHTVAMPAGYFYDVINRYAIWCTKEATYLAYVELQYWDLTYFLSTFNNYIRDVATGEKYKIIESNNGIIPLGKSYNIKGVAGQYVCIVDKYPPLPETCTVIDIMEDNVTDVVVNGEGWSYGTRRYNVRIDQLQANQHITKYKPIRVIE